MHAAIKTAHYAKAAEQLIYTWYKPNLRQELHAENNLVEVATTNTVRAYY
jgi:hypothetical protein